MQRPARFSTELIVAALLLALLFFAPWHGTQGATDMSMGINPIILQETTTDTPEPPEPTSTDTPKPPEPTDTNTPKPPEPTNTYTPEPPEPTNTNTPEPPEPTNTYTPEPPEPTNTNTPKPPEPTNTYTPEPTETHTINPTNTRTRTPTATKTHTPLPTSTSTIKPTKTPTPRFTATKTATPSPVTATPGTTTTPTVEATLKIEGYVWGDRNDNEQRDSGEGLPGLIAKLQVQGGSSSLQDDTSSEGYYHLDTVVPGMYRLEVSDPHGRLPTHAALIDARDPAMGTIRVDVRYLWVHAPIVQKRPSPTATRTATPSKTPPVTETPAATLTPTPNESSCNLWIGDWGDEFNDSQLSLWGVKAGDGVVEVKNSALRLYSVEGQSSRFPVVWARPAFPAEHWLLDIRFRFGQPTVYGTGIGVGTGGYDGQRYSASNPAPASIEDIISVHQNQQEWRISLWGTVVLGGPAPDTEWHLLQVEKRGNLYRLGIDGLLVTTMVHEGQPRAIWMGNPTEQKYWNPWTPLQVDYVRISRCGGYSPAAR